MTRRHDYVAPASYQQRQMWALDRIVTDRSAYGEAWTARLRGPLDVAALERAIGAIVDRHDTLRTTFALVDGELEQRVGPRGAFALAFDDLEALPREDRDAEARRRAATAASEPVDLVDGPVLRARAIRLSADEHWLVMTSHHIAFDRWSASVFARELARAYEAFTQGRAPAWEPLPVQYADYAEWQRERLDGGHLDAQFAYWGRALADLAPLDLPADRRRGPQPSHRGGEVPFKLDAGLADRLRALARARDASLFMVLLAAFNAFLARWTGQHDIAVAVPVAGRARAELEPLIGDFANVVVMRTDLAGDPAFDALLSSVRRTALDAYDHADVPFDQLVERLAPRRDATRNPFTQVSFRLRNTPSTALALPGLVVERIEGLRRPSVKFDFAMAVEEIGGALVGRIEYATDLFDAETISRAGNQWLALLRSIADDASRRVSRLPMQDARTRAAQLARWRGRPTPFPGDTGVHRLVEAVARASAAAVAIVDGERVTTYVELDARANRLARAIARRTGDVPARIGLAFERGTDLVVAMLAVLKAGHAYVPLDAAWPVARIGAVLADAGVSLVLCTKETSGPLVTGAVAAIAIDAEADAKAIDAESPDPIARDPADPGGASAYVIYTSGSTGRPKGVEVPHRAIARLVCGTDYVQIVATDAVANAAHPAFDATTFEIWGALVNGARLVVIPRLVALAPALLASTLRERGVSVLWLTASLFHEVARVIPGAFAACRAVVFGGEAAEPRLVRAVCEAGKPARLLNGYGPTEATTFATWHAVDRVDADCVSIPIGRPIANTTAWVLDDAMEPVPDGLPGELFLGGPGLANGYLGQQALTTDRFLRHPFDAAPGTRLYRTGDRVRVDARGDLVYLGRSDRQVKIRGHRIELDEVEHALLRAPGIRECAVVAIGSTSDERRLVAYAVPSDPDSPPPADLRRELKRWLPDVMLPSSVVWLRALPQNDSGKLDRRALPPPPENASPADAVGFAPPRDMLEHAIAGHVERVLGHGPVGIHEHFFEIGGHSLLAARLVAEIEASSGIAVPLAALFADDTIAGLADRLRRDVDAEDMPIVELNAGGTLPPLVLLHGDLSGGGFYARTLARQLGPDQPLLVVQPHLLKHGTLPSTIAGMAEDRLRLVRDLRPRGPYLLAGYCNGAFVAFEMAQQLAAAGEDVPLVVAIEALAPSGDGMDDADAYLTIDPSGASKMLTATDHASEMHLHYRRAMDRYRPDPYDGTLVVINSRDVKARLEDGWRALARHVDLRRIDDTHVRIVTHRAGDVAVIVGEAIRRAVATGRVSAGTGSSDTARPGASA